MLHIISLSEVSSISMELQSVSKAMDVLMANQSSLPPISHHQLIISVLTAAKPSIRSRILHLIATNANLYPNSNVDHTLRLVFLQFANDPYPLVRKSALDGMSIVIKISYPEPSYFCDRAVELFRDDDESVRCAAVRVVCEYGRRLADSAHENKQERIDEVFVQICSMGRDLSMKVRSEAFFALGNIQFVSENVLLQMLSKKVLGTKTERKILVNRTANEYVSLISTAAGAFIHGFEDEFYEVRKAACTSLGLLTRFSSQFAADALTLLLDLVNDDLDVVRLQALDSMYFMASHDNLRVQLVHMDMLLSFLLDADVLIRHAMRMIFQVLKLHSLEIFRSTIYGLLANLETYPEDEGEIFSVMTCISRNHKNFASHLVKKIDEETEPSNIGELGLDRPKVTTSLVLSLSMPNSCKQLTHNIPANAFTYAIPLLGKLYCSISAASVHDSTRSYLKISGSSTQSSTASGDLMLSHAPIEVQQQKAVVLADEAVAYARRTFLSVHKVWSLIKSRHADQALKNLQTCDEQISLITSTSPEVCSIKAFTSKYIKILKLLAKIWVQIYPSSHVTRIAVLEILLDKLDITLICLKYNFLGLSNEEELHILGLMLLSSTLRMSNCTPSLQITLKKIHFLMSQADLLLYKTSIKENRFIGELKKAFEVGDFGTSYLISARKLVEQFTLEQITLAGQFRVRSAELVVSGDDSEDPLPFIAGLPVGVRCQITLHNISNESRIWVQLAAAAVVEYIFLEPHLFDGSEEVKQCKIDLPYHQPPKASSFILSAGIGVECPLEEVYATGVHGGPKHRLSFLCKKKKVYMRIKMR